VIGKEGVAYLLAAGALGGIGGRWQAAACARAPGEVAWLDSTVSCHARRFGRAFVTPTSLSVAWRAPRPRWLAHRLRRRGVGIGTFVGTLSALNPASDRCSIRQV